MKRVTKQGAWSLWWTCLLTVGVYYFVWYQRTNREIGEVLGQEVPSTGKWWSQLVPFYAAHSRRATATRLNWAHRRLGSRTTVAPRTFSTWSMWWFGSHTRYLQRRFNTLHDVHTARQLEMILAA